MVVAEAYRQVFVWYDDESPPPCDLGWVVSSEARSGAGDQLWYETLRVFPLGKRADANRFARSEAKRLGYRVKVATSPPARRGQF